MSINTLAAPARLDERRDLIAAVRRETLRRERFARSGFSSPHAVADMLV